MSKTKKSLVLSCLSMLMCLSMLIGSTFAWFTDKASTSISTITSGTLQIEVTDEDGDEMVEFVQNGSVAENVLWEPGATFKTEKITVTNTGSLNLKFTLHVQGMNVNGNETFQDADALSRVIDWTIDGAAMGTSYSLAPDASLTFTITGHMDENAGNEYQGKTLSNLSVLVSATQDTVEYDSTTNQYDKNATNEHGVKVIGNHGTVTEGTYNNAKAYYINFTGSAPLENKDGATYAWFGFNVNVSDYVETGSYNYYWPKDTVSETEAFKDMGSFINNGITQHWCGYRAESSNPIYTYGYDLEGDGVIDFYVIADVSKCSVAE